MVYTTGIRYRSPANVPNTLDEETEMLAKDSRFTGLQLLVFAVVLLFTGFLLGTHHYDINFFAAAQDSDTPAYEGDPGAPDRPQEALRTAKNVEEALTYASRKARPAVVTIFTRKEISAPGFPFRTPRGNDQFDEFFRRFFDGPRERSRKVTGLGSGMIIRSDGYVLTNHHVIAQADEIEVMLNNRESVKAEVVGSDEESDLAVLKVDRTGLPTLDFANSNELEVGQYAIAIGSPFQMANSVSVGHVSALHRAINAKRYEDLIQTDAAINQGNSGGPLVNVEGEAIGINTLILSQGSQGSQGVGFAISANLAERTAEDLIEYGRVKRPWLGVVIQEVTSEMAEHVEAENGVIVSEVKEGSPADEAGLEPGDVIVEFDGQDVRTPHDLQRRVLSKTIGDEVQLTVHSREEGRATVTTTLAELPREDAPESDRAEPDRDEEDTEEPMSLKLGMELGTLSEEEAREQGIVPPRPVIQVEDIRRGSAASQARLQPGDLILRIGNEPVSGADKFNEILTSLHERGEDKVLLHVRRDSNFFTLLPLNPQ